jgi:hypothetical protein
MKHALYGEKPNKHGLQYNLMYDLANLTEGEQSKITWADTPDIATYYYVHFTYGMHRWLGGTEDYCITCELAGSEVSSINARYANYNVKEWTA